MPTVVSEGRFKFVVNTLEDLYEPPHVYVWVGSEDVCRIELNGGQFMDWPPPSDARRIRDAYARRAGAIRRCWDDIHKR